MELPRSDESLVSYESRNYFPFNSSQLSNSEEIRIPCFNSMFAHLSESCLYLEGSLGDFKPEALKTVKLVKNFPLFLFSECKLELNGTTIESIRMPGISSTMMNYCLLSEQDKSASSEFFWVDNLVEMAASMPKFSCCIPLSKIFGFCRDYRKVILFSKLEIVLIRSRTDLDIFAENTKDASVKVQLSRVCWKIPHCTPSDLIKLRLSKIIESGTELTAAFRALEFFEHPAIPVGKQLTWQIKTSSGAERPLYVILGLQKNRKETMSIDSSIFDHSNLRDAKLYLNSVAFPYESLDLNFDNDQFSNVYRMFTSFRESFLGNGNSYIGVTDYKKICPLIVFNTSRMPLEIKSAPIDVRLELNFDKDIQPTTSAYVLLIYDKIISYSPLTGLVLRQV